MEEIKKIDYKYIYNEIYNIYNKIAIKEFFDKKNIQVTTKIEKSIEKLDNSWIKLWDLLFHFPKITVYRRINNNLEDNIKVWNSYIHKLKYEWIIKSFNFWRMKVVQTKYKDFYWNSVYAIFSIKLTPLFNKIKKWSEVYLKWKISDKQWKTIYYVFPEIKFGNDKIIEWLEWKYYLERKYKKIWWLSEKDSNEIMKKFMEVINRDAFFKHLNEHDILNYNDYKELWLFSLWFIIRVFNKEQVPENIIYKSKNRIEFDKLFLFILSKHYQLKEKWDIYKNYVLSNMTFDLNNINKVYNELNNFFINKRWFKLTNSQKNVIENILLKLKNWELTNSIVQWDVWTWKTFVAMFLAIIFNIIFKQQVVITAPIWILIQQHFEEFKNTFWEFLKKYNITYGILLWSTKNKKKKEIKEKLKNWELNIIFWTTSLIQKWIKFKHLWLVLFDEQHKFWVKQRAFFNDYVCHTINMTATPIPRTIWLNDILWLDLYIINEFPKWPKKIKTKIIREKDINKLEEHIKNEFNKWHKMFIIANKVIKNNNKNIEENEIEIDNNSYTNENEQNPKIERKTIDEAKKLILEKLSFLNENDVLLVHWWLKQEEKEQILLDFKTNKNKKILISTTVVEVWIDVPEASIILILDANNFWLAQLHQLRWRVWRAWQHSNCYLAIHNDLKLEEWDKKYERLKIMEETLDWSKIAEADKDIRWIWELLWFKQAWKNNINLDLLKYIDRKKIHKLAEKIFSWKDKNKKYNNLYLKAKELSKILI